MLLSIPQKKLATFQVVEETEQGQEGFKEEKEEKEGEEEEKGVERKRRGGGGKTKERVEHSARNLENTWQRGKQLSHFFEKLPILELMRVGKLS